MGLARVPCRAARRGFGPSFSGVLAPLALAIVELSALVEGELAPTDLAGRIAVRVEQPPTPEVLAALGARFMGRPSARRRGVMRDA